MTHIPQFAGYYIDFQQREFRKILWSCHEAEMALFESIPFDSPRGRELLEKYYDFLRTQVEECKKELIVERV